MSFLNSTVACAFIGGSFAKPAQFPGVVYLEYNCTATLVSPRTILLAAHCVLPYKNVWQFAVGDRMRIYTSPVVVGSTPESVQIKNVIVHKDWVPPRNAGSHVDKLFLNSKTSDLAVLVLKNKVRSVFFHDLPQIDVNQVSINQKVIVGGYGCEQVGIPNREPRYKYAMKNIKKINGTLASVDQTNFSGNSTSMACEGDSGGPVFTVKDQKLYLVGVNSSVIGSEKSGVLNFVQLAHFRDWLNKYIE